MEYNFDDVFGGDHQGRPKNEATKRFEAFLKSPELGKRDILFHTTDHDDARRKRMTIACNYQSSANAELHQSGLHVKVKQGFKDGIHFVGAVIVKAGIPGVCAN